MCNYPRVLHELAKKVVASLEGLEDLKEEADCQVQLWNVVKIWSISGFNARGRLQEAQLASKLGYS
jgi:hypothetical protein